MSTADTQNAGMTDVAALEQLARELDYKIAQHVPPEIMRLIGRRIMTARLIEAEAHLRSFRAACAKAGV